MSKVFIAQAALTAPQLHHLRKSFDVTAVIGMYQEMPQSIEDACFFGRAKADLCQKFKCIIGQQKGLLKKSRLSNSPFVFATSILS